jgi:glycine betaine/choline ABC-type transport system substrate-binding protein
MVKNMDMDRFNLKKLHEEKANEKYQVIIKKKFAALEKLGKWGHQ